MNRNQWITIAVAAVNLVLIALFPPFDWLSSTTRGTPVFAGFGFAFTEHGHQQLNWSFLQLEFFVVLANAAIAWLLLRTRPARARRWDGQKIVLAGVALNLLLILLFPPMQRTAALVRAILPSFDGFYFVLGHHPDLAIVTNLLYLEVLFVLVNGALLYLLFNRSRPVVLTASDRARMAAELRR